MSQLKQTNKLPLCPFWDKNDLNQKIKITPLFCFSRTKGKQTKRKKKNKKPQRVKTNEQNSKDVHESRPNQKKLYQNT